VAKASPEGYTLLMGATPTLAISPTLYAGKIPYNALTDFTPITLVAKAPSALASHPAVPAKTIKELIALAKASPGKLNYATSGIGTISHLTTELFASMAGVKLNHVPYKGTQQSIPDLMSGQVSLLFDNVMTSQPNIKAGKVKGLAISSPKRSPLAPDLPTIAEAALPGFQSLTWFGLLGPANTPKAVVERVNAEMNKALALPDIQARFTQMGFESAGGSASDFAQAIQRDSQKWSKVIKDAGVKPE